MSSTGESTNQFSFKQRLGIVFICESAALSALAVSGLLLYIGYSALRVKPGATRRWSVSTHIHYYFVNLLVSDLVQALGGLLNIKWVIDAQVTEGALCTTQGMLKQLGDVGVAFSTMAIALHTLGVLVFGWKSPPRVALIVIAFIWVFLALIVGIGMGVNKDGRYYGNTRYWCWITAEYEEERIGLEYAWLYIAAFFNLIVYAFLALVIRGILVVNGFKIRYHRRRQTAEQMATDDNERTHSAAIAWQMMFYPAVYCVTVTPIAITRWLDFDGKKVPFEWTVFASILFSASGLFNVLLFKFTRPKLIPSRDNDGQASNGLITRSRRRAQIHMAVSEIDLDTSADSWKRRPRSSLILDPELEMARRIPDPPTPVYLGAGSPSPSSSHHKPSMDVSSTSY